MGMFLAVLLALGGPFDAGSRTALVYFIPLSVDTYAPVTPASIEEDAFYIFELRSKSVLDLLDAATRAPGTAARSGDEKVIRVKIVDRRSGAAVLVTQDKIVLKDGKRRGVAPHVLENALSDIQKAAATRPPRDGCRNVLPSGFSGCG
jgi:hypothetical protein